VKKSQPWWPAQRVLPFLLIVRVKHLLSGWKKYNDEGRLVSDWVRESPAKNRIFRKKRFLVLRVDFTSRSYWSNYGFSRFLLKWSASWLCDLIRGAITSAIPASQKKRENLMVRLTVQSSRTRYLRQAHKRDYISLACARTLSSKSKRLSLITSRTTSLQKLHLAGMCKGSLLKV